MKPFDLVIAFVELDRGYKRVIDFLLFIACFVFWVYLVMNSGYGFSQKTARRFWILVLVVMLLGSFIVVHILEWFVESFFLRKMEKRVLTLNKMTRNVSVFVDKKLKIYHLINLVLADFDEMKKFCLENDISEVCFKTHKAIISALLTARYQYKQDEVDKIIRRAKRECLMRTYRGFRIQSYKNSQRKKATNTEEFEEENEDLLICYFQISEKNEIKEINEINEEEIDEKFA